VDEVFRDITDGEIFGYTFKVLPRGYGGEITMLVGISVEGKVTGIEVVAHGETPGLGSHIGDADFKNQFQEKSVDEHLTVVKGGAAGEQDIEAISGATISSRAIVDGVNIAIDIFNKINE